MSAGKGSSRRSTLVPSTEVDNNWANIFEKTVPELSRNHREKIKDYTDCGCYFCLETFEGKDITDWIDNGKTALCPRCSIDAVLPKVTSKEKLIEAHRRWFCVTEEAKQMLTDSVKETLTKLDEPIVMNNEDYNQFISILENPLAPSQSLIDRFKEYNATKNSDGTFTLPDAVKAEHQQLINTFRKHIPIGSEEEKQLSKAINEFYGWKEIPLRLDIDLYNHFELLAKAAGMNVLAYVRSRLKEILKETIVGVGIESKGKLYQLPAPNRHHHCIHVAYLEQEKQVITESQGFITSFGRYVSREEGFVIATQANQIKVKSGNQDSKELFSEDCW